MRWEDVVHYDEVDFATAGKLDTVEAVKPREERMWVRFDMGVVRWQDAQKEGMFGMVDGLDNEAVVAREVEERTGLSGRSKLGENVFRGEGEQVICRVKVKVVLPKRPEYPRSVIFKLEVIFCRRC